MKVLVLSHLFPHNLDPSKNVFIEEQVKFLSEHCEIKVISPIPYFPPLKFFKDWYQYRFVKRKEIRKNIEVFRPRYLIFPKGFLYVLCGITYFFSIFGLILKIKKTFDFEIIHAHFAYPDGFAGVLAAKLLKKKIVVTVHGPDINLRMKNYFIRKLVLCAFRKCDKIISVSNSLKQELVDKGAENAKIVVIHNGVDTDIFHPMAKESLCKELNVSFKKRILYVGYIIKEKGVPQLLKAMEIVNKTFADAELILIGGSTGTAWKKQCEEIKTGVEESTLKENIKFLGKVQNDKIPLWMNVSDVLVLPSFYESFGVVLIEALACGIPVVSTYCGGPEDIVSERVGRLAPLGNVEKLAEAIKFVLTHEYKSEELRQYVKQKFDYNVIAEKIIDLYKELAAR